jgi:hypothetical protein
MTVIEQLFLYHLRMRRNSEGRRAAPVDAPLAKSRRFMRSGPACTDGLRGLQCVAIKRTNAGKITRAI